MLELLLDLLHKIHIDQLSFLKRIGYSIFYKRYLTPRLTYYLKLVELPLGCRLVVISYSALGRTLLKHRIWEKGTTLFLLRHVKPGHVFVDIGSNVGYYTCLIAHKIKPKGIVIAFEPEPISYKLLVLNVK